MIETRGASRWSARWVSFPLPLARHPDQRAGRSRAMQTHRRGSGVASPPSAEPSVATNAEVAGECGADPAVGLPSSPGTADVESEHRLQTLDARVERLEKELEGLQEALYRH